jgi:hypothetical protein
MFLIIDKQPCLFLPIGKFREMYQLPSSFGMNLFINDDEYRKIDQKDEETLEAIGDLVLSAVPKQKPRYGWYPMTVTLQKLFKSQLIGHDAELALPRPDIELMTHILGEVCRAYIYTCLRMQTQAQELPDFEDVYAQWLSDNIVMMPNVHHFLHQDEVWKIRVLLYPYGRFGLKIDSECGVSYVYDDSFICPAIDFMESLLLAIGIRLTEAIIASDSPD